MALDRAGVAYRLHPYDHDPRAASFGLEAASALGVDPARVFKTLLAVPRRVARGRRRAGVGPARPQGAGPRARRQQGRDGRRGRRRARTGYVAGGISPSARSGGSGPSLDASALAHDTILVSAGRRGLDLEMAPADLVVITGAITDRVGRS